MFLSFLLFAYLEKTFTYSGKRLLIRGNVLAFSANLFRFLLQNYKENRVFDGNKVQKTAKIVSKEYN